MSPQSFVKRAVKRVGKRARRALKHLVRRLVTEPAPVQAVDASGSRRILLIRPNFRIGNAAISTPLIACFRAHFPEARIDFLGTDRTRTVLLNQPVDTFYTLSRRQLLRPWEFLSLLRRLRRNRYDLAVQINAGSLTGYLVARLVRVRYTMGRGKGGKRWYHLEVSGQQHHAYDNALNFARALGTPCPDRPVIHLTADERSQALEQLRTCLGMRLVRGGHDFCAVFVGGRAGKRWPLETWLALIRILEQNARRFVVFLGPEELRLEDRFRDEMAGYRHGILVNPRPLREFCALLSFAQCLITPDSGPMHLAAGLEVPTITLIRARVSLKFVPRGEYDIALVDPTPTEVHEALIKSLDYQRRRADAVGPIPHLREGSTQR